MSKRFAVSITVALLPICVGSGCAGYDHLLFFTKTNVGLDVDSTPPTMELTISRREGVIEPTLEGGTAPPVLASFRSKSGAIGRFVSGVGMTFATGDAAYSLAKFFGDSKSYTLSPGSGEQSNASATPISASTVDSSERVTKLPVGGIIKDHKLYGPGQMSPLVFGTDTSLGLKAGWSGQTAAYPSTVKFGFNRKEFAFTPVTYTPVPGDDGNATQAAEFDVKVPSLIATLNSDAQLAGLNEGGIQYQQFFATGKAATELALKAQIREAMVRQLVPGVATITTENKALGEQVLASLNQLDPSKTADVATLNRVYSTAKQQGVIDEISGFDAADGARKKSLLIEKLGPELKRDRPSQADKARLQAIQDTIKGGS